MNPGWQKKLRARELESGGWSSECIRNCCHSGPALSARNLLLAGRTIKHGAPAAGSILIFLRTSPGPGLYRFGNNSWLALLPCDAEYALKDLVNVPQLSLQ